MEMDIHAIIQVEIKAEMIKFMSRAVETYISEVNGGARGRVKKKQYMGHA